MKDYLFNWLKRRYDSYSGLIIGWVFIFFTVIIAIDPFLIGYSINSLIRIIIYILIEVIWYCAWIYKRNDFLKNEKGKIGIVLSIHTENDKQANRIKNDLVEKILNEFNNAGLGGNVKIILVQENKAERLNTIIQEYAKYDHYRRIEQKENANPIKDKSTFEKISKRIKGHFYIWGNIRERKDGEQKYFLSLDALVVHSNIPIELSNKIAAEFQSIWKKSISFPERFEMQGFEMTSITVMIPVRYITGYAALVSKDVFIAIKMHEGLFERIESIMTPIPPEYVKMISNLKNMLVFEYSMAANYYFKISNEIERANECIKKAEKMKIPDYSILLLKSVIAFIYDKNPIESLRCLKEAKKISKKDFTWLYNKAFILMYLERYKNALDDYRKLNNIQFDGEDNIVNECIEFNKNVLLNDHKKKQSIFVIGYLNLYKKQNLPIAFEYFERFLKEVKDDEDSYAYLYVRAKSYIVEICKKMEIE